MLSCTNVFSNTPIKAQSQLQHPRCVGQSVVVEEAGTPAIGPFHHSMGTSSHLLCSFNYILSIRVSARYMGSSCVTAGRKNSGLKAYVRGQLRTAQVDRRGAAIGIN